MTAQRRISESGRLAPKTDDGLYPVTIITEGSGSSGDYDRELLERQAAYWSDALSFADHPADPNRPWERSVNSIAGRLVGETTFSEEGGKGVIKGMWKPRAEYREFVEEFGDAIGLSIYAAAKGEDLPDGRLKVSEWVEDPYKSVDVVVAAGRGGKFDRAAEALRTIEASLGIPSGKSDAKASESTNGKESISMEISELSEQVKELKATLESFISAASPVLEALKPAEKTEDEIDIAAAIEALVVSDLPKSFRSNVIAAVTEGAKIEDAIKAEKARVEELRKELAPTDTERVAEGFVTESDSANADFSVSVWSSN